MPGAIEQLEIPEAMLALGVPVRLRATRSSQKAGRADPVLGEAFEKAGLFVPDHGELRSAGHLIQVTGHDIDRRSSVSVLLQPNLDGTTTVLVGEAALGARKEASRAERERAAVRTARRSGGC